MKHFAIVLFCIVSFCAFAGEGGAGPESGGKGDSGPGGGPGSRGRNLEIPENDQQRGRSRSRNSRSKKENNNETSARTNQHTVSPEKLETIHATIEEALEKLKNTKDNHDLDVLYNENITIED